MISLQHMRLGDFIDGNIEPILMEWEVFARSLAPGTRMEKLELRNDAERILRACSRDMSTTQTLAQQNSKSQGHAPTGRVASDRLDLASTDHGVARVVSGFNVNEVVSEYRALRASVLRLWRARLTNAQLDDVDDITRFNEAMDQSLARAIAAYTKRVDQSRRMFLSILSHDVRNPLGSIMMSAELASRSPPTETDSIQALSQIRTSVKAIERLITDLFDFASTGIGQAMPITLAHVDVATLCREVADEVRAARPAQELRCDMQGDLTGMVDGPRLRQLVSNLLGNAIQHGACDRPIELIVRSDGPDITLTVRNQGAPIPPELIPTVFDPLVRGRQPNDRTKRPPGSVGLGLYIASAIVTAHQGTIDVESSAEHGTVFTVCIPRMPDPQMHPIIDGTARATAIA